MGYEIVGFGPPSSGGVHIAQMLNMLDGEPLATMDEAERYHLLTETMKLAFADRAHWLGDADFVPVPKGLVDVDYAKHLRALIDPLKASAVSFHQPPHSSRDFFNQQINQHTTHLTTADVEGNWVAITTTLNTSFGSKVMIPDTGVLLNNQMDDFVAAPNKPNAFGLVGGEANSIAPFKRPLSSMSPTLVLKAGKPVMTIGAAGGPTIITQVLQGLVNYLALNEGLLAAINQPRVHHQWQPDWLFTELPLDGVIAQSLRRKGHDLKAAGDFGGTQAIALKNGLFEAVTEPRVVRRNDLAH
jgi:gamma-glutamyltranspeptidase/glutathione hydrolase